MKITLLGLLLFAIPVFGGDKANILRYYYIPFQIETYEPITPENIRNKAEIKGEVAGADASKLLGLLMAKKEIAAFDKKRVRLLVETQDGKNPIFVDAAATVLNGPEEYAMSSKAFAALREMLTRLMSPKPSTAKP